MFCFLHSILIDPGRHTWIRLTRTTCVHNLRETQASVAMLLNRLFLWLRPEVARSQKHNLTLSIEDRFGDLLQAHDDGENEQGDEADG
jgi:hypothetical protein